MQIPNISLAYQLAELKPVVEGSVLRKVQELENKWLKLKLQTRQGTKDLIAAPDTVFLTSYLMPAKQMTSGYGAFLRKQLSNKRIVSLEQHGLDRIVVMGFEGFFLIFELFAKGNVVLTDDKMKILSAFRKEQWKDRTLRKGFPYNFPSSKGINPVELKEKHLKKAFAKSDLKLVTALIREVNIAPIFAEAACSNAGIEKETPAGKLSGKQAKALAETINKLYRISQGKEQAILVKKEDKEMLLPFPLNLPGTRILQRFPKVNEAIDTLYSKQFNEAKTMPARKALDRKKAELRRSMQRQEESLEALKQSIETNTQKAELIYENYGKLFELLQAAKPAFDKNLPEKEVMYKLQKRFPFLKSMNLKGKRLTVSLQK